MKLMTIAMIAALLCLPFTTSEAGNSKSTFNLDETYAIDPDGTLYLDTNDAEIRIAGSDRADVHIIVHYQRKVTGFSSSSDGQEFQVRVSENNGNLYVHEIDEDGGEVIFFGSVSEDYEITIEVPRTISLNLDGDDDDYMIEGIGGEIRLDMDDGDATIRDARGDRFEIAFQDGSVELFGGSGMLDVSVDDGAFFADDGAFSSIEARFEDGDLEISSSLSDEGRYRFRGDDGRITLNVLAGGGTFDCDLDDGSVRASKDFTLEEGEEGEGYELYRLPGGDADVRIRIEDGTIRLRKR